MHPTTKAIRLRAPQTGANEHSSPLYLTSSFCFEDAEAMRAAFADENDAHIYSRFSNPNVSEFQDKMCALEGAESGFATASGMSAVTASILALLKQGDHLLCCRSIFGSTHTLVSKFLPKFGISHTYVDASAPETWEREIRANTRMLFLETPTNPGLEIIDLEFAGRLAAAHGLLLNVDNCFATPIAQQPIRFGAHLVTHSATKWIDGQGRVLGGIVLGKADLIKEIYTYCRSTGPALSPFNAWVLSKSLETLDVRMERHSNNAYFLAEALQSHPALQSLKYPFLPTHPQYGIARVQMSNGGGIFCFELKGGLEAGRSFLDKLKMISLTANLGDTRTIASHPASTTHARLTPEERLASGITDGLIRISAGLEHRNDILNDILQALDS